MFWFLTLRSKVSERASVCELSHTHPSSPQKEEHFLFGAHFEEDMTVLSFLKPDLQTLHSDNNPGRVHANAM